MAAQPPLQLDLFAERPTQPTPVRSCGCGSIEHRFEAFHAANPLLYEAVVSIARELKRRGWKRAGMKAIFEQIRWQYMLATNGDRYKLNNIYTAPMAQMVMRNERDLESFFETRERAHS